MERSGQFHSGYLLIKSLGGSRVILKAMGKKISPWEDIQELYCLIVIDSYARLVAERYSTCLFSALSVVNRKLLLHRGSLRYILLAKHYYGDQKREVPYG
jgi:hypothetical protein